VTPVAARDLLLGAATRHTLEGPRWRRTSRGFYLPSTDVPPTPTQRIVSAASILPDGAVIGGWAAAFAHGVDLLDGLDDHTMQPRPISVHLPPGLHRHDVTGLQYRQSDAGVEPALVAGIPVTPPLRTAVDLARWASNLTEAVVALDLVLGAGLVGLDGLRAALADVRGARGVVQARRAAELARTGVRSSWESRLRMAYVLDLGFPAPLVNPAVLGPDRTFVAMPDLLDEEAGLALEYDGASWTTAARSSGHRDVDQHRADNLREEQLERTGLFVTRADKEDLGRHRTQLLRRLAAAREHGLGRDRRRDRWRVRRSGEK